GVNFSHGQNMPRDHWQPAPLRPAGEIASLKRDIEAFVTWVKRQPGVHLTTYRGLLAEHRQPAGEWVTRAGLLHLLAASGDPPRPGAAGEASRTAAARHRRAGLAVGAGGLRHPALPRHLAHLPARLRGAAAGGTGALAGVDRQAGGAVGAARRNFVGAWGCMGV